MSLTQLRPRFNPDALRFNPPTIDPDAPFEMIVHGVTVKITKDGVVKLDGYKKLSFGNTDAEVDIVGKNVNITAGETLLLEGKHHAIMEAERIDLNPDHEDFDFKEHVKNGTTSL